MKRSALALSAVALALAFVASACSSGGSSSSAPTTSTLKPRDTGEAIAYDSRLSTFATALNASGVLGQLSGNRAVTVFAPDNTAFARIPHATLTALLTKRTDGRLAKFIRAHVVRGAIRESALRTERVKTIDGQTLTIKKSADGVTVSDGQGHTAALELPPIDAAHAVIYPIKSVLSPAASR